MLPVHLSFVFGLAVSTSSARAAERLNDPKILNLVIAASVEEIVLGRMALRRTRQTSVQIFAENMIREHSLSLHKAKLLAQKLRITPLTCDTIRHTDLLSRKSGHGFDRDYVEQMEDGHRKLLAKLDSELIAHARNADLKSFLQDTRATVQAHLTHAEQLRSRLY